MRECCPKCGLKSLKGTKNRRMRATTVDGKTRAMSDGSVFTLYTCVCGWRGEWHELAKRRSRKSEKRAKQIAKRRKSPSG